MCTLEGRRKTDEEVAAPGKKKKDGSSFVEPTDVAGSSISLPLFRSCSPLPLSRPSPTSKEAAAREAGRV